LFAPQATPTHSREEEIAFVFFLPAENGRPSNKKPANFSSLAGWFSKRALKNGG